MVKKFFFFLFILSIFVSCKSSEKKGEEFFYPKPYFGDELYLPNKDDNSFTICVIPDTQKYFHQAYQKDRHKSYPMNQYEIANRQMEWIVKNSEKNGGDISFALMVGDIINNHHWYRCEWEYADKAFSILDNQVPFLYVMGNHDFDNKFISFENKYNVSGNRYFLKYFGPNSKHYKNKEINGGFYKDGTSSWQILKAEGIDFLVIGLEFEPNDDVLVWANKLIQQKSNYPVILVTHSYLSVFNELPEGLKEINKKRKISDEKKIEINELKNLKGKAAYTNLSNHSKNTGFNSGKDIFEKLVKPNKNIFLVLCGHSFAGANGENSRIDINDAGYPVYSFMSNYQGRNDLYKSLGFSGTPKVCGDGWLRLMTFNMKEMTLQIKTYSTEFNCFEEDSDSDFLIKFDWDWETRFNN